MEPRTVSGAAKPIRQSWPESFWGEGLRQNFPRLRVKSGGESEFFGLEAVTSITGELRGAELQMGLKRISLQSKLISIKRGI